MDPLEFDDGIYTKNLTMQGLVAQVDSQRRKQPCRCVTVCLGLLCALLLAGNVGQIIYYEIITHRSSADPLPPKSDALTKEADHLQRENDILTTERDRLQSNRDSLTAERKQLEARLSNLTEENDQLQHRYNSERDELKTARNRLQTDHDTLKQEQQDMQRNFEVLQSEHTNLTTGKEQLQTQYGNLQTRFSTLVANRDQLQSNYSSLQRDKDQLQRSYDNLGTTKNNLQTSYNSLQKNKDRLQTTYETLRRAKEQQQTQYNSLATGLQVTVNKLKVKVKGMLCQGGWQKFDMSCYFVSTLKKNWTESRQACVDQGADLVVMRSRDEQVFVNGILKFGTNAWIGLTDSVEEGTWMWLDGTPVTRTYWKPGQPDSYLSDQDCGEIVKVSSKAEGEWNDDGCFAKQVYVCEK